jgi:PRTRC genetic system protein A
MRFKGIKNLVDYFIGKPKKITKPVNYILAGNGAKEIRENEIAVFTLQTDKVAGLEPIPDQIKLKLPKIELNLLFQIISFFKEVYRKQKSEAMAQIYWDRKKERCFIYIPEQEVSGASVEFKRDLELDKEHLLIADIHSHGNMDAFFSGTDNKDEQESRFFGVIGHIQEPLPRVKLRAIVGGKPFDIDLEDLFSISKDFPESWLDNIKLKAFEKSFNENQCSLWNDEIFKDNHIDRRAKDEDRAFLVEELAITANEELDREEKEELIKLLRDESA